MTDLQAVFDKAQAQKTRPAVSFEFFPPKTAEAEEKLWGVIQRLAPLSPSFVSVTYGAGGTTRDRTHRTVARIASDTALKPAAHLTCVAASRAEVDGVLQDYWAAGVRHIVALRGDPPGGIGEAYHPHPDGYINAADLVAGVKRAGDFEVSVAVYPERHPNSANWDVEIDNFKRKLDAGATRGISQFFYEADHYLRFRDRLAAAGVTAKIVPGVMPVTNFKGLVKMAAGCGASVPDWFHTLFDGLDNDPETRTLVAAATTGELCARLQVEGVEEFHFYTLNRAELTMALCRMLGVRAAAGSETAK
jgi:methylenetetrahydrofolate reductase (NADPH)